MKLKIIAVGTLKGGPERVLVDDYLARLKRTGRAVGLRDAAEIECASGGGCDSEAERLLSRCDRSGRIILLDEGGKAHSSEGFAQQLGRLRDSGCPEAAFLIGGAEGHGAAIREAADQSLAFGPQTWPHKLVRVMLAEQLYRAATILAGQPYHKA